MLGMSVHTGSRKRRRSDRYSPSSTPVSSPRAHVYSSPFIVPEHQGEVAPHVCERWLNFGHCQCHRSTPHSVVLRKVNDSERGHAYIQNNAISCINPLECPYKSVPDGYVTSNWDTACIFAYVAANDENLELLLLPCAIMGTYHAVKRGQSLFIAQGTRTHAYFLSSSCPYPYTSLTIHV